MILNNIFLIMTSFNKEKKVYVIVHGQKQHFEKVESNLIQFGFIKDKIIPANMQETGNPGDYVAMIWPPMAPIEIILSEIINFDGNGPGKGAWADLNKKELERIPLT